MSNETPITVKVNFDINEQRTRQTREWTLLANAAAPSRLSLVIKFAIAVVAVVAAVVFFVFTREGNKFGIAAIVAAVVASVCLSGGVTDILLARSKRKKALAKLEDYITATFGALPPTCEMTFSFADNVGVSVNGETRFAALSDCSSVEFENMLAVDFGEFGCYCFTAEELGEQAADIKALLKNGERYQYLVRGDLGSYRLENNVPSTRRNA